MVKIDFIFHVVNWCYVMNKTDIYIHISEAQIIICIQLLCPHAVPIVWYVIVQNITSLNLHTLYRLLLILLDLDDSFLFPMWVNKPLYFCFLHFSFSYSSPNFQGQS